MACHYLIAQASRGTPWRSCTCQGMSLPGGACISQGRSIHSFLSPLWARATCQAASPHPCLPLQDVPLPWKPGLQVQVKPPNVLEHAALASQLWVPLMHSFTSEEANREGQGKGGQRMGGQGRETATRHPASDLTRCWRTAP